MVELAEVGPKGVERVILWLLQRKASELRVELGFNLNGALQLERANRVVHVGPGQTDRVLDVWGGGGRSRVTFL
jgi:hypothetical protein